MYDSQNQKTSTRIYRFRQLLSQLHSAAIRKITWVLRTSESKQMKVTGELLDNYKAINAALAEACGLALKQPITGRQYVLMTGADDPRRNSIRKKRSHQLHMDQKCFPQHS